MRLCVEKHNLQIEEAPNGQFVYVTIDGIAGEIPEINDAKITCESLEETREAVLKKLKTITVKDKVSTIKEYLESIPDSQEIARMREELEKQPGADLLPLHQFTSITHKVEKIEEELEKLESIDDEIEELTDKLDGMYGEILSVESSVNELF